jgi:NodT family efflux transporter outer membrane factor (OMF) lipoprotein
MSCRSHGFWWATLAAGLLGCAAVRPVALHPTLPAPPAYVVPALPSAAPEDAARAPALRQKPDTTTPWWTAFADPALDAVIDEALENNYFLRDLRTLIYENQLDPAMPNGLLWPLRIELPASVQYLTVANPPTPANRAFSISNYAADVGISASYEVDVWGQLDVRRRTLEDTVEQQRQNTERFAQTLAMQVSQLWFEILELRAQHKLLEDQVQYSQELLTIVKARFEQQLVTRLVVLQQEQQLLNTRAQVPLIVAQLTLLHSRLNALLGRAPNPKLGLVPEDRRLPDLPPPAAVGVPADLLRNSPDMRFAQSRVAEAEHLVSQNLASWLPTISVFGGAGVTSYLPQNVVSSAFGVRLTWPIFDGGQRVTRAKQLALTVGRRNLQYQSAFNDAVQRVQDVLVQEHKQVDHLRTLRAEVELGRRVLHEARQLFEQGLADYLPVLTALANVSALERAALQAQKQLLTYRIQLYFALGGTWSSAAT